MKLIRFGDAGVEKPGVLIDGERYDCSTHFRDWDNSFFIDNGLEKLRSLIENNLHDLPKVATDIRWASCVARPGMIMCIGLNYSDHAAEAGMAVPEEPVLFMKATNTIQGPYDPVMIPKGSTKTDWEVELAIILKKDISYLSNETEAEEAIAGFCIMHDVSERTFQLEMGGQWVKGKSCPGFSPVGPYLATPDEIMDVHKLKMQLWVNGELMQNGNTSTMIFRPAFIVHYLSQFMKLEAGDIITTGTPPGVGMGKKPSRFLKGGDVVKLSIEDLGDQKQVFKA